MHIRFPEVRQWFERDDETLAAQLESSFCWADEATERFAGWAGAYLDRVSPDWRREHLAAQEAGLSRSSDEIEDGAELPSLEPMQRFGRKIRLLVEDELRSLPVGERPWLSVGAPRWAISREIVERRRIHARPQAHTRDSVLAVPLPVAPRTAARARSPRRAAKRSTRSSLASGDSGSDSGEPAPAGFRRLLAFLRKAVAR